MNAIIAFGSRKCFEFNLIKSSSKFRNEIGGHFASDVQRRECKFNYLLNINLVIILPF